MQKKVVKPKKETSLDDLARMVQNGFAEQEKKFDIKLDNLSHKLEIFKKETNTTLKRIDTTIESIDKRLAQVEKILGPLLQTVNLMQMNTRDLEKRVSFLESKLGYSLKK